MALDLLSAVGFRTAANEPAEPKRDVNDPAMWGGGGYMSAAGYPVSAESAMRQAAVYACVQRIARVMAAVPLIVYEQLERGKRRVPKDPLWRLLHDQPNPQQTSFQWREMTVAHLLLRGKARSEIKRDASGRPVALLPLHPDRVLTERLPSGELRWRVLSAPLNTHTPIGQQIEQARPLMEGEILRVDGLSINGLDGLNPIEYHAHTIGLVAAEHDYYSRFMRNDARPGGILQAAGKADPKSNERVADAWQKSGTGENRHKVRVLPFGYEFKEVGMKHTDAQFLEMLKYTVSEIAAMIFMVPVHLLGILDRATFSNIEQQYGEFIGITVLGWCRNFESSIKRDLILDDPASESLHAEFLLDGLLRGDSKARGEYYQRMVNIRAMTPNEVRERENLNPLPGGDVPLHAANMTTGLEEEPPPEDGGGTEPPEGEDDDAPAAPKPKPKARAQAPGPVSVSIARATAIMLGSAERALVREMGRVQKLAERTASDGAAFKLGLGPLYADHAGYLAKALAVPLAVAEGYCTAQRTTLEADGVQALARWGQEHVEHLAQLALEAPQSENAR